jgi:murein DD-endopeptidase MepM/ murein hydrolase activator NlpD
MKKAFLKAPLNFTRISSKFTYNRKHPVLKIVRPHTGVDYAAPSGTPVVALGEGVVIHKGWAGGGGNTIKIKHPGNYVTSYMHLRGYAKGIKKGSRVAQGELIGYVGSTGLSTGPHLDFRVYKNGVPIDPLKMESPSVEPIAKEYMDSFEAQKEHYYKQADSLKVAVHIKRYYETLGAEYSN